MAPIPMPIPTKEENPNGLHGRYLIGKPDGSPLDEGAQYFVLRLDDGCGDPNHLAACRAAIHTYADHIQPHLPVLAANIRAWWGKP